MSKDEKRLTKEEVMNFIKNNSNFMPQYVEPEIEFNEDQIISKIEKYANQKAIDALNEVRGTFIPDIDNNVWIDDVNSEIDKKIKQLNND